MAPQFSAAELYIISAFVTDMRNWKIEIYDYFFSVIDAEKTEGIESKELYHEFAIALDYGRRMVIIRDDIEGTNALLRSFEMTFEDFKAVLNNERAFLTWRGGKPDIAICCKYLHFSILNPRYDQIYKNERQRQ